MLGSVEQGTGREPVYKGVIVLKQILMAGGAVSAILAGAVLPAHAAASPGSYEMIMVSNHADGGGNGFWAEDNGTGTVIITRTGPNTYTGHLSYSGSFKTIPGAFTPNQSVPFTGETLTSSQHVGSTATTAGSEDYSFTASRAPNMIAQVKVNGDNPRASDWPKLAFPSNTVFSNYTVTDYSFIYRLRCSPQDVYQTWTETSENNDGQQQNAGNINGC